MSATAPTALFDASQIDLNDASQATASATRICQAADTAGIFAADVSDPLSATAIRHAAREWICAAREHIASMPPADALEVVAAFDMVHRAAYGVGADPDFVNRYTLRAFDARIHGDQHVNEYTLFRQIEQGLRRRDRVYFDRPLQWYSMSLDRWHKQFATGVSPQPLSDYDTVQRVTILLRSDLWAFETRNEAAYKRRLLTAHRHLLEHISAFSHQ